MRYFIYVIFLFAYLQVLCQDVETTEESKYITFISGISPLITSYYTHSFMLWDEQH